MGSENDKYINSFLILTPYKIGRSINLWIYSRGLS